MNKRILTAISAAFMMGSLSLPASAQAVFVTDGYQSYLNDSLGYGRFGFDGYRGYRYGSRFGHSPYLERTLVAPAVLGSSCPPALNTIVDSLTDPVALGQPLLGYSAEYGAFRRTRASIRAGRWLTGRTLINMASPAPWSRSLYLDGCGPALLDQTFSHAAVIAPTATTLAPSGAVVSLPTTTIGANTGIQIGSGEYITRTLTSRAVMETPYVIPTEECKVELNPIIRQQKYVRGRAKRASWRRLAATYGTGYIADTGAGCASCSTPLF